MHAARTKHTVRNAGPLASRGLGLGTLALLALAARPVGAQTTIDTTGTYYTGTGVNVLTAANAVVETPATYLGQTFTAPADDVLTSLTFATWHADPSLSLSVYQINAATLTTVGGPLFTGAPTAGPTTVLTPLTLGVTGHEYTFTFGPGGLTLTAGQTYAALLENTGYPGGILAVEGQPDAYAGGTLVSGNGPSYTDESAVAGQPYDAVFVAQFNPAAPPPSTVPEPSQTTALGLGAVGVLGLLARARRRKAVV